MSGVEIKVRSDSTQARRDLANLEKSVKGIETTVSNVTSAFTKLAAGIGTIVGGSVAIQGINKATDALTSMENRLALVVGRGEELQVQMNKLYDIASKTRQPVDAAAETFNRFGLALKGTGRSVDEINLAIESIGYAGAISGGSVDSLRAALFQLGQGLASGTLRGEELNSVLEQAPRIASAISDSLGVSVGALRKIAEKGELTTEVVFDALLSQSEKLREEFSLVEQTSAQAFSKLGSTFKRIVGEIGKASGITSGYTKNINALNKVLEANRSRIVGSVSNVINKLRDSLEGATAVLSGIANIIVAIGQRASAALPKITTPMREFSNDLTLGFISAALYARKFFRQFNLDLDASINKFFDIGYAGAFRELFSSKSIKEFGDNLYNLGEVLKRYGSRWYNLNNQSEKFLRSTKQLFLETGVYLGVLDQKVLRLRFTSFERFGKAINVINDALAELGKSFAASDTLYFIQITLLKIYQFAKVTGEALNNASGGKLAKTFDDISRTFKSAFESANKFLKPLLTLVNSTLDFIERKFFWVYDKVIGNSWWTDTVEQTYHLAEKWLGKTRDIVKTFANEISDLYKYIKMVWTSKLEFKQKIDLTAVGLTFKRDSYVAAIKDFAQTFSENMLEKVREVWSAFASAAPKAAGVVSLAVTAALTRAFAPAVFAATFAKLGTFLGIGMAAAFIAKFGSEILSSGLVQSMSKGLGQTLGAAIKSIYDSIPVILKALVAVAKSFGEALVNELKGTLIGLPAQVLSFIPGGGILTTLFYGGITALAFSSKIRGAVFSMLMPTIEEIAKKNPKGLLYNMFVGSDPKNLVRGIESSLTALRGPAMIGMTKESRKAALRDLRLDAKEMAEEQARQSKRQAGMAISRFGLITAGFTAMLGDAIGTGNAIVLGLGAGLLDRALNGPNGVQGLQAKGQLAISIFNNVLTAIGGLFTRLLTVSSAILQTILVSHGTMLNKLKMLWWIASNSISYVFGANMAKLAKFLGVFSIIMFAFSGVGIASTGAAGDVSSSGAIIGSALSLLGILAITNLKKVKDAFAGMALFISATMPKLLTAFSWLSAAIFAPVNAVKWLGTQLKGMLSTVLVQPVMAAATRIGAAFTAMATAIRSAMLASILAMQLNIFAADALIMRSITRLGTRIKAMLPVLFGEAGLLSGTAFATAFAAAIPVAIVTAVLSALFFAWDAFFNNGELTRKLGKWIKTLFIKAGEYIGIGISATDLRKTLQENIAEATKRFKAIGLKVDIDATISSRALNGLNARDRGNLDRSMLRVNELSLQAMRDVYSTGRVSNETQEAINAELKLQTAIMQKAADPAAAAAAQGSRIAEGLSSQRGVGTMISDLFSGKSSDSKLLQAARNIENIDFSKILDPEEIIRTANAVANNLRDAMSEVDPKNQSDLQAIINQYESIAQAGVFTPEDQAILEELSKRFVQGSRWSLEIIDTSKDYFDRFSGNRLNDIQLEALRAETVISRSLMIQDRAFKSFESLVAGAGYEIANNFIAGLTPAEMARIGNLISEAQRAQAEVDLLTYKNGVAPAGTDERARQQAADANSQLRDDARRRAAETKAIADAAIADAKNFVIEVRSSIFDVNQQLSNFGITSLEVGANITAAITDSVNKIINLNKELAATATIKDASQRAAEEERILRALESEKIVLGQNVDLANTRNVQVTERMGLLESAVSSFDKFDIDFNKLIRVDPATLERLIATSAEMEVLNQQIAIALSLGQFDVAADASVKLEELKNKIAETFKGLRSSIQRVGTGGGGKTGFEKLTEQLSAAGASLDFTAVASLDKRMLESLQGPLKQIEDAQKRINKSGFLGADVRKEALKTIEAARAKIVELLTSGTVAQANAAGQMLGIDNAASLTPEQLAIATNIATLQERLNQTSNTDLATKKAITLELEKQQLLLDSTTIAAEEATSAVAESLKSNFGEFLKGTKSLSEAFQGLMDTVTNAIIDTFVNTLIDALWKGPLESMFEGFFAGLASSGANWGKSLGESLGESMSGGMMKTVTDQLFGEGGLFSMIGTFFKSIFSIPIFGGAHTGGVIQSHHAGGIIRGLATGGIVPMYNGAQMGTDSVPVMLTPGEYVLPSQRAAELFKKQANAAQQQTVVNLNVTGDISRQTKKEILRMIPQITNGVNATNRERS